MLNVSEIVARTESMGENAESGDAMFPNTDTTIDESDTASNDAVLSDTVAAADENDAASNDAALL